MLPQGSLIDGRFEVEAMVGEGGMAQVYRVRHRELGRVMALKLLTWRKQSLVERLVLEGRIQAQLTHPNIVAVVDLVRHDGQVGLLMEYIQEAETLDDVLEHRGALPVDEALELFAPVLSAVGAAHAVGVTHRDLKPANVMLARVGSGVVPKVTDFGIAKVVSETSGRSTRSGATMGTPGYLAPEQVRDASTIDGRADIFALGAIAYELMTGRQAFLDAQGELTVASTLEVEPPPLAEQVEVPENVAQAVHRAMAKDAAARFDSCEAFAEALLAHRPDLLAALRSNAPARPLSLSGPDPVTAPPSEPPAPATVVGGTLDVASLPPTETGPPSRLPWLLAGGLGIALLLVLVAGGGGALLAAAALQQGPEVATGAPEPEPVAPPEVPPAPVPAPAPAVEDPVDPPSAPEPVEAAVAPVPAPAVPDAPAVAPEPEPELEPEPEGADAPEPEVVPEPEPEPEVVEAAPAPVPAPAPAPAAPPDVSGRWAGTAGRQPIELELSSDAAGAVTGAFTITAGATTRRETLSGTVDGGGALTLSGGGFEFRAQLAGNRLAGQYMARNKKWIEWSVER